jgi:hypothetical protein
MPKLRIRKLAVPEQLKAIEERDAKMDANLHDVSDEWTPEFRAWVDSRPEGVRKLCYEFPLGSIIVLDGLDHHLLGYNESDMLILSPIDPYEDYDGANENAVYLCAEHIRAVRIAEPVAIGTRR